VYKTRDTDIKTHEKTFCFPRHIIFVELNQKAKFFVLIFHP